MNNNTHHTALINAAITHGWIRGHAWRSALAQAIKTMPGCSGEWFELCESIDFIECPHPDMWRLRLEGKVLVLEFLEVEVTSGIAEAKDELYRYMWDMFDATHYYHLRIWHMDRFGVTRPYITNSTFDPMVFGMNANWRG